MDEKMRGWLVLLLLLRLSSAIPPPALPPLVCPDIVPYLPPIVLASDPLVSEHYCQKVQQTVCQPQPGWIMPDYPMYMVVVPGRNNGTFPFGPNTSINIYGTYMLASNATYQKWPMFELTESGTVAFVEPIPQYYNLTTDLIEDRGAVEIISYLAQPGGIGMFYYPPWQLVLQYPARIASNASSLRCSDTLHVWRPPPTTAAAAIVQPRTTTTTRAAATITTTTPTPSAQNDDNVTYIAVYAVGMPLLALLIAVFVISMCLRPSHHSSASYEAVPA